MKCIKYLFKNLIMLNLFVGVVCCFASGRIKEKPLVAIICSYNNIKWVEKNLDSIFSQRYKNYRVIYVDDGSTDGTADFVENYIKQHALENKVTFIRNKKRLRKLANVYRAIHLCEDDEIVVMVDGDDWLANRSVFAFINKEYADANVWFTYGQYRNEPAQKAEKWGFSEKGYSRPLPKRLKKRKIYRACRFVYMHLRTFYAWLFKLIKLEDLIAANIEGFEGDFYPASNDLAMYYPMAEMANQRVRFISKVLYVRNLFSDIVGFKIDSKLQRAASFEIRKKCAYAQRTKSAKDRLNRFQQAQADLFLFCNSNSAALAFSLNDISKQIKGINATYVFYVESTDNNKMVQELSQSFSYIQFIPYNPDKLEELKERVREYLDNSSCAHVLLLTSNVNIVEQINAQELIHYLEQTVAQGFYLDRSEQEELVPRHVQINEDVCAWKLKIGTKKWKSMLSIDGALYRKKDVRAWLKIDDLILDPIHSFTLVPDNKKRIGLFYKKERIRFKNV